MTAELPDVTWKERLLYFLGRRQGFIVEGSSMEPALYSGDAVLIKSRAKPVAGDIVLANHPYKQSVRILKRIREIDADGRCFLVGDNPADSTDSRTFGTIPAKDILGKATCRIERSDPE